MKSFAGNKSSLSLSWYGLMLELFCGHDMRQRDTTLPANLCGFVGKEKDRYAKTIATIELETIVTYIQKDTRNIYLKQSYKKHLLWTCHVHDLGLMISRNKQRKKHIFCVNIYPSKDDTINLVSLWTSKIQPFFNCILRVSVWRIVKQHVT